MLPPQPWVNSTDGIHLFLTFDYAMNDTEVRTLGHRYDYVWGAKPRGCASGGKCDASAWRTGNPGAVISWYITYDRDPHPYNLSWYEKNHPT